MKLRWRGPRAAEERNSTTDAVAAAVWEDGILMGPTTTAPVIKAPRAGDLAAPQAG